MALEEFVKGFEKQSGFDMQHVLPWKPKHWIKTHSKTFMCMTCRLSQTFLMDLMKLCLSVGKPQIAKSLPPIISFLDYKPQLKVTVNVSPKGNCFKSYNYNADTHSKSIFKVFLMILSLLKIRQWWWTWLKEISQMSYQWFLLVAGSTGITLALSQVSY